VLNNLANTVDDHDEGLAMAQESLRIATEHDFSAQKLAEIHHTLGFLHKRRGDLDLAARHYGEERALLEVALGPDHPDLGHALHSLGRVEAARGDNAAARRLYEATLQLWRSAYGDDHMLVAFPLLSLGELDLVEGRPDAAVSSLRAALSLWLAHPGDPRKLAQTRFALARALWHREEDRDEARMLVGKAREWFVSAGANEAAQLAELDAWRRDHR
jgi:eukaryotic-like serine/threonine-protein kinase